MGGQNQVFKPRFTELIKVFYHGIVVSIDIIVLCFFHVQFLELQVQFRHLLPQLCVPHLLPQLCVPQLLEDVVSKDTNECYLTDCDRGMQYLVCKNLRLHIVSC